MRVSWYACGRWPYPHLLPAGHLLLMQDGETALIWAAWHGHTEVVEVLLNAKANVDATNKVWCAGVLGWGAVWSPS